MEFIGVSICLMGVDLGRVSRSFNAGCALFSVLLRKLWPIWHFEKQNIFLAGHCTKENYESPELLLVLFMADETSGQVA